LIRYLGIKSPRIEELVREHISEVAYEDGRSILTPLMIDPPPLQWEAGAYRETNTQHEKEPGASVLWKGVQSLISTVRGQISARIRSRLWAARQFTDDDDDLFTSTLITELTAAVRSCDQFHPVFVTDAQLWMVGSRNHELASIPWCRLILSSGRLHPHFWLDVVNREHIAEFCTTLTQGYQAILEGNGAEETWDEYLL
jgi:hypothetical protein